MAQCHEWHWNIMARNIAVKVSWDGEDQKKVWFRLALFSRSTFIDTRYNMKKILLLTMNWMYLQLERRACFGGKRNCIGLSEPPFFSKKVSITTIEWWMVHYHQNSCHSHYFHRHGIKVWRCVPMTCFDDKQGLKRAYYPNFRFFTTELLELYFSGF